MDARVTAAMALQETLKEELVEEGQSVDDLFLDVNAKERRAEEEGMQNLCHQLFLSYDELETVVEKGERGGVGRQILSKVRELTQKLSEKSRITFGERRYMEGLMEVCAIFGMLRQKARLWRAVVLIYICQNRACLSTWSGSLSTKRWSATLVS
jgi:hypothetical protein